MSRERQITLKLILDIDTLSLVLSFSMNSKVDSKKTVIISLDDENKTKYFERNKFTSVVVDSAFVYPFPIKLSKEKEMKEVSEKIVLN